VNPATDLVYKPLPQDDPQRRKPDITKAKTLLNWSPTVPLQDGLTRTIEDFRQRMALASEQPPQPVTASHA
jgi:UDP-glucuronate decarboxylase